MSKLERRGGIGFTGLLTILFIALKLLGKIDWSWVWVLSPVWISLFCVLPILFGLLLMLSLLTD